VVRAWDVRDVSDQVHSMGAKWVTVDFKVPSGGTVGGKGADLGLRDEPSGNDLYIWKIHHFLIGKSSLNKWGFNMINGI